MNNDCGVAARGELGLCSDRLERLPVLAEGETGSSTTVGNQSGPQSPILLDEFSLEALAKLKAIKAENLRMPPIPDHL